MFGNVDGTSKRGRPCREWMDDIVSWCKTGLQELNSLAQDLRRWKLITRQAMDTNGHWSHGSWRRWRRRMLITFLLIYDPSLASVKSRMVSFLVPAYPGCPGKKTIKRMCVCVFVLWPKVLAVFAD